MWRLEQFLDDHFHTFLIANVILAAVLCGIIGYALAI
jgi:hypothetical protein